MVASDEYKYSVLFFVLFYISQITTCYVFI